jgi:hypothetical protein
VAKQLSDERHNGKYIAALRTLSQSIACVELVPYRSSNFSVNRLLSILPSAQAALAYVRKTLVEKARADELTIIVTRNVAQWGLPKMKNIVVYKGGLTRGAPMGPSTPDGKAILERLGI